MEVFDAISEAMASDVPGVLEAADGLMMPESLPSDYEPSIPDSTDEAILGLGRSLASSSSLCTLAAPSRADSSSSLSMPPPPPPRGNARATSPPAPKAPQIDGGSERKCVGLERFGGVGIKLEGTGPPTQGVVLYPRSSAKLEPIDDAIKGMRELPFSVLHPKATGGGDVSFGGRLAAAFSLPPATQLAAVEGTAGAAACRSSVNKRKRSCEQLKGKSEPGSEGADTTVIRGRAMRARRGASTRSRGSQSAETLEQLVVRLMKSRGRDATPHFLPKSELVRKANDQDVIDFDKEMAVAVTHGPVGDLQALLEQGRSPNACTQFGETCLHRLARRGDSHADKLRLLLRFGASVFVCDDFGRTPLHDAFWCQEPATEVVAALLSAQDGQASMLMSTVDCRGALPVAYAQAAHHEHWKKFFTSRAASIWPKRARKGAALAA